MPTALIAGASRGIGLETVKAALAAGYTVRALARTADAIALDSPRLEKVPGDALDPKTIARALDGTDAVVQALGVPVTPKTVLEGTTLFSQTTRVLIEGMHALGVRRLIAVTGLEAGDSRGSAGFVHARVLFPIILQRIYDDKTVQETIIRSSGLVWTIVRPALLTNGPATGRYHALTDAKSWRGGFISRRDVAHFVVGELTDPSCIGKTPLLVA